MTKPTNVVDRHNINNGVREDLIDKITNVDEHETPVTSMCGRTTAAQTYHEYQRDSYRSPNPDNAAVDGDDATAASQADTQRLGNYCQIFEETYGVTGRAERVRKAGRKSELARLRAKASIHLKRDLEARIISTSPAVAGGSGVASKMAGLARHIYTNAQHNGSGATPSHTSGAPTSTVTAGTGRAYTETLLLNAAQNAFRYAGKAPPMWLHSPAHKRKASTFPGIADLRHETGKSKITVIGATDVYLSDFGPLEMVPHAMMHDFTYVLGIDPDFIKIAYLRGYETEKLGRTGDSEREQMIVDATLEVLAEKNMAKIADLTTSGS